MFRKQNGTAKRFDPNALVLSQLQTLKERLIAALEEFLNPETDRTNTSVRAASIAKIDAIQNEITAIAVKLAISTR